MGRFRGARAGQGFKARHASTMLTFDAVVDALGQIAAAEQRADPAGATA